MTHKEWLCKAREIHLCALADVLRETRAADPEAVSEILIKLKTETLRGIYRLRRFDILHRDNEGQIRVAEVNEEQCLSFEPFVSAPLPGISIRYAPFHWYNLQIRVVGEIADWTPLERWAHYWMDADDARFAEGREWSLAIHDVTEPSFQNGTWTFAIDLGSAQVECVPLLVNLLIELGAQSIQLGTQS